MDQMEIERKWLMDGFPDLPPLSEVHMEQGYLAVNGVTVRIRKASAAGETDYRLTIKGGGGLARTEVELGLSAAQYGALLPLLVVPPVGKLLRTYRLPGGETLECSLVDAGAPTAFYYAEVEFDSVEQAHAFVPPAWVGPEKTEDPEFSMAAYCLCKAQRA